GFFNFTLLMYVNKEQNRYHGVFKISAKAGKSSESQTGRLINKVKVAPNSPPTAIDDFFGPVTNLAATAILAPGAVGNDLGTEDDAFEIQDAGTPFLSVLGATVIMNTDGSFNYDPTTSTILQSLDDGDIVEDQFVYTLYQ